MTLGARVRVGIMGGAFDPPHVGHVLLATYVLSVGPFDRLLVVPTFEHPFGKQMAPYAERVRMIELALAPLASERVTVSRIEEELGGASYTVRTLEALSTREPTWSMRLVAGADLLRDTSRWRDFPRVAELAPPFVVGRAGHGIGSDAPLELPEVSSTDVRARLARGDDASSLVPHRVLAHIDARALYRAASR